MRLLLRIACFTLLAFFATTLNSLDPGILTPENARVPGIVRAPAADSGACRNIHKAVCQKKGVTRDPTGTVRPDIEGEIQALRAYEEIIRAHPDWTSEQVDEELVRAIYTPKARARLQSAFEWVRKNLEKQIQRQPDGVFTQAHKQALRRRIQRTVLELPPPMSVYADEPELFTKNDVFYERLQDGRLRLRVGGAYILSAKSWFNFIFTLAHELAHAIDPCELRSEGLAIPAYDRLSECFLANGLIASREYRTECGSHDQLSETFADWIAARVAADALRAFATEFEVPALKAAITNSVRDLCEQDDPQSELDTQFHPAPEIRIDRIFGRNPQIRTLLGCAPPTGGPEYCNFTPALPERASRLER
ncbi:MAG: hypothetical protein NDJ89_00295 [Oligoflexia bacterium]|nr:hypothetical protein [Oligoflexia bacterium]